MKKKFLIALSMLVCMSAFSLVLTACGGNDDDPIKDITMTQEFVVKGEITSQSGNYANGEAGLNDPNTKEFALYKAIYDEVKEIIKPQVWTISFKASEKSEKIKEQNNIAEQKFSAMFNALKAVQTKLNNVNKDEYKCNFDITIQMVATGEGDIRKGEMTLKYQGNE